MLLTEATHSIPFGNTELSFDWIFVCGLESEMQSSRPTERYYINYLKIKWYTGIYFVAVFLPGFRR